ncbi:MAG: DUF4296 domain-containing protein [Odoribacteraceae bacterium]|jgi:hypothetical protein|nr:DUF4296 domain-containing protein [Odoribacteraceae bacterium]
MKQQLLAAAIAALVAACSSAPLSERRFADLLVDIHTVDGVLSDPRVSPGGEREKYMYYTGVFQKHGVTREQFDSCVHYYSAQPDRYDRVYDRVLRVLEGRDTANILVWRELTREDTVNLLPPLRVNRRDTLLAHYIYYGHAIIDTLHAVAVSQQTVYPDTLRLDDLNPRYDISLDNLQPGRYEMRLRVFLDSTDTGKNNRIAPRFISLAGDTLFPRPVNIYPDASPRDHAWSFYLQDTTRGHLRLRLIESDSLDRPAARRSGWITNIAIYRKYLPPKEAERVIEQQQLWQRER